MMITTNRWGRALSVYADVRMTKILLLGFISGFPWLLIGSMVSLWLQEEGVSRSGIGLFGLVFGVYSVNVLWAPFVDGIPLPWLSRRFGQRRAWIILMQLIIAITMVGMALLPSATTHTWWVACFALIIASASATQDIAIDALRINMIKPEETEKIGAGSAMATSGWWIGFGGSKAMVFPLIGWMQSVGVSNAWQNGYLVLVSVIVLSITALILFIPAPKNPPPLIQFNSKLPVKQLLNLYIHPIQSFFSRHHFRVALFLLLFIFLFKIGEAFLGRMSILFYKEIGFSIKDIGLFSGGLGAITICIFSIFGSFINARYGLLKGIFLGGISMALTNLLFAWLAINPTSTWFIVAVVSDQFTTAISTVAFVAFISQLCVRTFAGTQYAALSSLGNLSRTFLASSSGFLVDTLENNSGGLLANTPFDYWTIFFFLTTLMVIPSLFILYSIRQYVSTTLGNHSSTD